MAQRTTVVLIDDIDGGDADETVSFSLDGVEYEIDLTSGNASKMRDAFAPYIGAGRKAGRAGGRARRTSGRGRSGRTAEIRAWAREHGHKVNERGRIPTDVVAAYDRAHG